MLKSQFEFEVLVHGTPAREYIHKGSTYIEGKEKSEFSLKMRNNSGEKVLFVPTVDGLSIMDGKEASFKSRGYVVPAYTATTIEGWRTASDNIAKFFFTFPKNSYAKKVNKGDNLGVIGCAVFRGKVKPPVSITYEPSPTPSWPWFPIDPAPFKNFPPSVDNIYRCSSTGSSQSLPNSSYISTSAAFNLGAQANAKGPNLGTGFGEDKYSPTTTVTFETEDHPAELFSMYYDTHANLEAMGIEFKKPLYVSPSAFPGESGFCERP